MDKIIVVDGKVITVGIDDYRTLKSIEAAFSRAVLEQHADGAQGGYAAFKKNLKLGDYFALASRRAGWIMQDRKGIEGQPVAQSKALALYCEAAVDPLRRTFGDAALLKALPAIAHDERVAELCRGLGAPKLAMLCETARKAAK